MCGARGRYDLVRGRGQSALVCQCGQWVADRLEIVLKWQGTTYRLTHDQRARRLRSYTEAEAALVEINSQIERRTFDPSLWKSRRTNRLLWENYLADWLKREEARATKATFEVKRAAARHLAWFNGMNVRDIRTAHVQDYFNLPCIKLALAPNTRKNVAAALRQLFREAVERDDIEKAPRIPRIDAPEQPILWMGPKEQARALEAMPEEHRPIFRFLMLYGCRVAEACALCWDAIDRQKGLVWFRRTFSRRQLRETTKTRRARALPIFDEFAAYLDSQTSGVGVAPVFRNPHAYAASNPSAFYSPEILNRIWRKALRRAGLPHVPLKNATRHSRGMQAINLDGWGVADAQALLGHTSPSTTLRFYAHTESARLRGLVDGRRGQIVNLLSTTSGDGRTK